MRRAPLLPLITAALLQLSTQTMAQEGIDEIDLLALAEQADWSVHFPLAPIGFLTFGPVEASLPFGDAHRRNLADEELPGISLPSDGLYVVAGPQRTTGVECGDNVSRPGVILGPPARYYPRGGNDPRAYVQAVWSGVRIPFNAILEWDGCLWGAGISEEKCDGARVTLSIRRSDSEDDWNDFLGEIVHAGRETGAEGGSIKPLEPWYNELVDIRFKIDEYTNSWADHFLLYTLRIRRASEYEHECIKQETLLPFFEAVLQGIDVMLAGDSLYVEMPNSPPQVSPLPGGIFIGGGAATTDGWVAVPDTINLLPGFPTVSTTDRFSGGIQVDFEFEEGPVSVEGPVTGQSIRPAFTLFASPYVREGLLFFAWGYEVHGDIDIAYLPDFPAERRFRSEFQRMLYDRVSAMLDATLLPQIRSDLQTLGVIPDNLRAIIVHHDEVCLMSEDGTEDRNKIRSSFAASIAHEHILKAPQSNDPADAKSTIAFIRYYDGVPSKVTLTAHAPEFEAEGGIFAFGDNEQLLGGSVVSYDMKFFVRAPLGLKEGIYTGRTELRRVNGDLIDSRDVCIQVGDCEECDCDAILSAH